MSLKSLYETSKESETDGIHLIIDDLARVTLCRAGGSNVKYNKAMAKILQKYQKQIDGDPAFLIERNDELLRKVYVDTVIINFEMKKGNAWQPGVEGPDGETILPFTKKNVSDLLERIPVIQTKIVDTASSYSNYLTSLLDKQVKKS